LRCWLLYCVAKILQREIARRWLAFTMTAPLHRDGDADETRATWSSTQQMTGREATSTSPLIVSAALQL
jgi:hypothetical protein